ncbi:hypothetical protein [Oscillatoria acuminata]|uniref:hypothetical protein n=1 Tax=Oscillatoria acuminata TaxID=118323 RepID=UPI0012EAF721|nr:hypothetical protein [Oscillatoria acuminata]
MIIYRASGIVRLLGWHYDRIVTPIAKENQRVFLGSVGVKPLIYLTHRHPQKYSSSETRLEER